MQEASYSSPNLIYDYLVWKKFGVTPKRITIEIIPTKDKLNMMYKKNPNIKTLIEKLGLVF